MRILLAEDDAVSRRTLSAQLEKLGHEVTASADGIAAWTEFDRKPFRVVVSDWVMPRMDGLELCRRIRSRTRTDYAYFILVTAESEERQYYLKAMDSGVDDFLVKPADAEVLAARLRVADRMLNLHTQVEQLQGILPICVFCKRIRDDKGSYQRIESFIEEHSGATFSHGFCPECARKHYPATRGG